jgi:tRNA(Ile)-lysidine synthase
MAASRKSSPSDGVAEFAAGVEVRLDRWLHAGARVTVALSGGLDSVVLLDCLARLRDRRAILLEALHVNHGLSAHGGAWAAFCGKLCGRLGVPLRVVDVHVDRGPGESLEAAARRARYAAFRQHVSGTLVLAHHLDDQAETILLQLLRGAGPRGAGAMPRSREAGGDAGPMPPLAVVRPLLGAARSRLEGYARTAGLTWVDDESNADTGLDRNYLRACVLPLIEERFPGYRKALARSAELCGEASGLLDELAAQDGTHAVRNGDLDVAALRRLSEPRARNLLRWFLRQNAVAAPAARRLGETVRQLVHARPDQRIRIVLGNVELRCYLGCACLQPVTAPVPGEAVVWRGEAVLPAPGGLGDVHFTRGEGAGIALGRLSGRRVDLRPRQGGERIQPDCRRPRRTLKNLLQEHRIEPWQRARLPLLFCDGHLVWVPGIGIDCAWQAGPGDPGLCPVWRLAALQGGFVKGGSLQSRDY